MIVSGLVLAIFDQKSGLPTWWRLRGELADGEARLARLSEETSGLRDEIRALEEDPFAIERAIREELELARPGEVVIRFSRSYPN
jgi:cell division protein FtsB